MKLISPADDGVVSGNDLFIEVDKCKRAPHRVLLDGNQIEAHFERLPYKTMRAPRRKRQWVARFDAAGLNLKPGAHEIEVSAGRHSEKHRFHSGRSVLDIAMDAAMGYIDDKKANRHSWNWDKAIFWYGVVKLAEHCPEHRGRLVAHLCDFYRHWDEREPQISTPDKAAAALAAVHMRRLGYWDFPNAIDPAIDYLRNTDRLAIPCDAIDGAEALDHVSGILKTIYGSSIWADSLMMYVLLAAYYGVYFDDPELLEFALTQHDVFACKLLDNDTDLYGHAYRVDWPHRIPRKGRYWLRGNSWIAASTVEILDVVPAENEALRTRLVDRLNRQLKAASAYQMANGLWDTMLNIPGDTFVDTSGGCLLAYATLKGIRLGYVDPVLAPMAHRVHSVVTSTLRSVGDRHVVTRIAGSTNALWRQAYRMIVLTEENRDFGVGAYLMLAVEENLASAQSEYVPAGAA